MQPVESREKQKVTRSVDDGHNRHGPAGAGFGEENGFPRIPRKLDPERVVQFRWVAWVLALLVVCLLLAAWVWFEILAPCTLRWPDFDYAVTSFCTSQRPGKQNWGAIMAKKLHKGKRANWTGN